VRRTPLPIARKPHLSRRRLVEVVLVAE